jgi:lipoprotein signal peptidase
VRFAIFNFADILITCGVVWLAIWVLVGEPRGRGAVKRT